MTQKVKKTVLFLTVDPVFTVDFCFCPLAAIDSFWIRFSPVRLLINSGVLGLPVQMAYSHPYGFYRGQTAMWSLHSSDCQGNWIKCLLWFWSHFILQLFPFIVSMCTPRPSIPSSLLRLLCALPQPPKEWYKRDTQQLDLSPYNPVGFVIPRILFHSTRKPDSKGLHTLTHLKTLTIITATSKMQYYLGNEHYYIKLLLHFYLKLKYQQSYSLSRPCYKKNNQPEICSDIFHWLYLWLIASLVTTSVL